MYIKKAIIFSGLVLVLAALLTLLFHKTGYPEKSAPLPGEKVGLNTDSYTLDDAAGIQRDNAERLIVIDPGHGGIDPGASSGSLLEKDIVLDICLQLDYILKNMGIPTVMTRRDDTYVDFENRIFYANSINALLYLSVHCDSFTNLSCRGTSTLYYPSKNLRNGMLDEMEYALTMQEEVVKQIQTKDRHIIERPNLLVLKHADMPSVIVELGFLSNKLDAKLFASPDFRKKAAQGLANGIIKSLEKIEDASTLTSK